MSGIKLSSVQTDRVIRLKYILENYRGAVLEGEPGVGKTFIACEVAKDYQEVLYIGKAFALDDVKDKVAQYLASNKANFKITFVSYTKFSSGKFPRKKYDLYIWDESHMLARYSAGHTKRYSKITSGKHLHLTGTPMKKSPMDYLYVLRKCGLFESTKWFKERYFNAKQSHYHDGLELGAFRNQDCFTNNRNKIAVSLLHSDLDVDSPETNFHIINLGERGPEAVDITEMTKIAVACERIKVNHCKSHIRKIIREENIQRAFVLVKYRENAKILANELKVNWSVDKKSLITSIKDVTENGGIVLSTLGLCGSSFDFNACDHIFMVGTTYTFAEDMQAVYRCKRFGKDREINIYYFMLESDHALGLSFQRQWLMQTSRRSLLSPSQLKRLEQCPGSYWLPPIPQVNEKIRKAAQQGTVNHDVVERYLNNPRQRIDYSVPEETRGMIKHCRALIKESEKHGVEGSVNCFTMHKEFCGTVDFWSFDGKTLNVVDYKNGTGAVSAKNNLQLMAYTLMISDTYNIQPSDIVHTIYQRDVKKDCIYAGNVLELWRRRIQRIIDNIKEAKDSPLEYINPDHTCDFFCPARKYHDKAKEEQFMVTKKKKVSTKKKPAGKGKFKKQYPDATFQAKVVGVSKKKTRTKKSMLGLKLQVETIPDGMKKAFPSKSKEAKLLKAAIEKNEEYGAYNFWANNLWSFIKADRVPEFLEEVEITVSFKPPAPDSEYQNMGISIKKIDILSSDLDDDFEDEEELEDEGYSAGADLEDDSDEEEDDGWA